LLSAGAWSPRLLGGQALVWADFSDGATLDISAGSVAAAANKGAVGGVFAQATASKRPALVSAGPGGRAYASFDGVDDVLVCPAVTIAPASTLWMLAVHRRTASAYHALISTTNQPSSGFGFPYAGAAAAFDWVGNEVYAFGNGYQTGRAPRTIFGTLSATDTLWHALSVSLGPAPAAELDGNTRPLRTTSAGGAVPAYTGQLLIGALTQTTEFFAGGIAELLIVADPTRDQIDMATGYACWKYGLQSLMPATHPYRNRPPGVSRRLEQSPMPDLHVRRGQPEYARALAALLPRGPAWPRDPDTTLMRLMGGMAAIWADIDGRAGDLLERESDPRAPLELLPEWERAFGLPESCTAEPLTIEARQQALVTKMVSIGGQSRAFFLGVAEGLGYDIRITEHAPFMAGMSRCGDTRDEYGDWRWEVGPPEIRFWWTVRVTGMRVMWFRTGGGGGQCGIDPMVRISLATDLECLLRRWKPAHTDLVFDYSAVSV